MMFQARFCDRCEHQPENPDDGGCGILLRSMVHDIDEDEYPTEWVRDENGPRCTAFHERGTERRCEHTIDMFEENTTAQGEG